MLIALQKNARTTPPAHAEFVTSCETATVLIQGYGITAQRVYKRKKREVFGDRSLAPCLALGLDRCLRR